MNYSVDQKIKNNKHSISIRCKIPNLKITQVLNFRIHKSISNTDNVVQDPEIPNSNYIFNISKSMLNSSYIFEFLFDINEISKYKSFIIGFCDEFIQWNEQTFLRVDIDKTLGENSLIHKNSFLQKNSVCILSSWNIKCGISQYSKNIVDSLVDKKFDIKVFPHTTKYSEIFSFIRSSRPKSFIVQYEPSLILDFKDLKNNIIRLKSENIKTKIFFTIHSEYSQLMELDGLIDGFIYHKNNTMPFRRTKVFNVPMGVPVFNPELSRKEYKNKYGIDEERLVISTVGFMFAWKNHANVLSSLIKYMKDDPKILVQYMTSFHSTNNGECIDEFNKINSIVKENSLENQFLHITDYISQKELNERLYLSDVGFLWSGIETTSSSASLKEFVASRLPVVKTNSTHYHDIVSGTVTTEQDIGNFSNIIIQLIMDSDRRAKLQQEMEENYNKLNYSSAINNLIEVLNA
jgi:glycosyltransferase involved in cell wall biosynthesis